MKNLIFLIFILAAKLTYSQDYAELRHVQGDTYKCDFYVLTEDKKIKHKDTVVYTWYKSQKIMNTQGSSSGNVLNGTYKKYYLSSQLAEYGNYKMGLKVGKWQTWDEKGMLTSISNYNKGQISGKFYKYEDGKLTSTSKYKKGKEVIPKEPKEKKEIDDNDEEEGLSFFKKLFSKKETKEDEVETESKEKKKWFSKKEKGSSSEKTEEKSKKPSSKKKDKKSEE